MVNNRAQTSKARHVVSAKIASFKVPMSFLRQSTEKYIPAVFELRHLETAGENTLEDSLF